MKSKPILFTGGTTGIGLATARFLLTNDSSAIIGENFTVDGGVRLP
jgi:NAD(P)-dependent dehydrogenase (short-subunit alcohol dehydrogenase family)